MHIVRLNESFFYVVTASTFQLNTGLLNGDPLS